MKSTKNVPAKVITKQEYYSIVGLLHLGRESVKRTDEIIDAMKAILCEDDDASGHCGDAVYGFRELESLLGVLGVKVAQNSTSSREE